jgi:coenzyme F420-reducing hydrogenase delta subunit
VARAREMLDLLGIGQDRLVEKSFASHEKSELVGEIWDFAALIEKLGGNPAKPRQEREVS